MKITSAVSAASLADKERGMGVKFLLAYLITSFSSAMSSRLHGTLDVFEQGTQIGVCIGRKLHYSRALGNSLFYEATEVMSCISYTRINLDRALSLYII